MTQTGSGLSRDVQDLLNEPLCSRDAGAERPGAAGGRQSDDFFRTAFERAPIGMALIDVDGHVLEANAAMWTMLGYSESEWRTKLLKDVIHPDGTPASKVRRDLLVSGKIRGYEVERKLVHKQGHTIWAAVSISSVYEGDKPSHFIVQVQDITERKRAEEILLRTHDELEARVQQRTADLREANEKLQEEIAQRQQAEERAESLNSRIVGLLENMSAGFVVVRREGWRFAYVNKGAERIMRRCREEIIGKNTWEVFPHFVGTVYYDQFRRAMFQRVTADAELYHPRQDRWVRVHIFPVPEGAGVLLEDVTERHIAESAAMSDILRAFNAELDMEKVSAALAVGLRIISNCDRSSLTLFDEEGWATITTIGETSIPVPFPTRVNASELSAWRVVLAGKPFAVTELEADSESPILKAAYTAGLRSTLSVPLRLPGGGVSGMLNLGWCRRAGANSAQLHLLGQIADAVALVVRRGQLFEEVRVGRERLQALSHRLLEVQEAERRHIARELHDEVGQQLTGLKFVIEAVRRVPAAIAVDQLAEADKLIDALVARVRALSLDLRPAMLDDFGLISALLWLFDRHTAQTNVQVVFEQQSLEQRFPPEVETAAYRIIQEALTNVARHAGVDQVFVRVWLALDTLHLLVEDNGVGFDSATSLGVSRTSGLPGMRERAFLLGGSLTVKSVPGRGTQLCAELPAHD